MTEPAGNARPFVLCPLEFERQMLDQCGLAEAVELICTGPGADNIATWALAHESMDRTVILAGLAGALSPEFTAGSAHIVTFIVDENGDDRWTPSFPNRASNTVENGSGVVVTSTQAPVTGRLARRMVSRESGGMLIDLESVAFATHAVKFNWPSWGIVRGVSDDMTTLLPEGLDEWVNDLGRTRWSQVMRSLLLRPQLIPRVMTLREHSVAAMKEVAAKLRIALGIEQA